MDKINSGLVDATIGVCDGTEVYKLIGTFWFLSFYKNIEKTLLVCRGMMGKPCLKNTSDTVRKYFEKMTVKL